MTTHDELRKLAEAATQGEWSANVLLKGGHPAFDDDMVGVGMNGGKFVAVCGAATSEQSQIDARYVAATNPETILALLDELEQYKKDAERYRLVRAKVCIVGSDFHVLNLRPTYVAPDPAAELDAAIDAAMAGEKQ